MKKILVIATHPDDETLGCGGTLLRHKREGDEIHWVIVTSLDKIEWATPEAKKLKSSQIEKVNKLYGFSSMHEFNWPTTKLDTIPLSEQVSKFDKLFKEIKPEVIYLPFWNDIHSDHRFVFETSFSCTKTFRHPYIKEIYAMEVPSETDHSLMVPGHSFVPQTFVDITSHLEQKIEIMKVFDTELGEHPFPRSIASLKSWSIIRGSQCGYQAAEAFMCLKYRR